MLPLDEIQINFNTEQVALLNICLGFLMFGVALDLKIDDFKYIGSHFRSVWVGLVSQWLLLPILTMGLIWILQPEVSLALGMLLIAACPGGNVSNYAVHLAKANAALSVVLTMVQPCFVYCLPLLSLDNWFIYCPHKQICHLILSSVLAPWL